MIKFYIVDDHKVLSDSLKNAFVAEGFVYSGSSVNGNHAVDEILMLKPDVILMDIDLPGINGLSASTEILKSWPEAKIIMLTMHLEKSLIEKAIKIGVKGYLPKNTPLDELIKALKEVSENNRYFSPDVTTSLAMGTNSKTLTHQPDLLRTAASLSERETEVLQEIARGNTNKEIAQILNVSQHTVDSHRKNIMQKLDVNNTAGLIRFAIKSGICD